MSSQDGFNPIHVSKHKTLSKEETVTMVFPHHVNLTLDNHDVVSFEPGPQEVPVSLKDHWYLKANKAKLYEPEKTEEEQKPEEVDLNSLTKEQLIEHASKEHGLELSVNTKKAEIIAAIEEAKNVA